MRKIGLDLGSKTCGIAISDESNCFATGLYNFEYKNNDYMQIINKLKQILIDYDYKIDTFVLGYAYNLKTNNENEACKRSDKFRLLLQQHFNLPVICQDENFSTSRASELLLNDGIKASLRKKVIDMISATIILQDYLDNLNNLDTKKE